METKVEGVYYMAWWWHFYFAGLIAFVIFTRAEPDPYKIERMVRRAIRWRIANP